MKVSRLKYIAMGAILGLSFVSCEDFLDRPNEDSYNDGNYFQNDAQTKVSVNTLYNSPWYDFLSRGYYKIPEALSGNLHSEFMAGFAFNWFLKSGRGYFWTM